MTEVIQSPLDNQFQASGCVLTMGNFDGVHKGHKSLLFELNKASAQLGLPSVVLSFDPHPLKILQPDVDFKFLFSRCDLAEQLSKFKVSHLVLEPFTEQFSRLSAEEFLDTYVLKKLKPSLVVLGEDFHFGKGREGNVKFIENWCEKNKILIDIVGLKEINSEKLSSSKVKEYLSQGEPRKAAEILERPFSISGVVVRGLGNGKTIGVPTANLNCDYYCPKKGVYFTNVVVGSKKYPSITNIGTRPTLSFGGTPVSVESHLLNVDIDLYDKEIKVELLEYHRAEIEFANIEELKKAIKVDIKAVEVFFERT